MSQAILKLENGNKVENTNKQKKPTNLIEYGSKKYDYSELENAMFNNNADSYLASQGITGKAASEIKNHIDLYAKAFKEGKIKRNPSGTFDVYDESLITDDNPVKRGIFGRIRGDKKRLALGYIDSLFSKINPYTEPSEESTPVNNLQKFSYGFGKQLRKDIYKGNPDSEYVRSLWYSNPNKWDVAKAAANRYRESLKDEYDFSDTVFKDKNEYLSALDKLDEAINSKDQKALQTALYNIGEADLYNLFKSKDEYNDSLLTPEQRLAKQNEIQSKRADLQTSLNAGLAEVNKDVNSIEDPTISPVNKPDKISSLFQDLGKMGDTNSWHPGKVPMSVQDKITTTGWVLPQFISYQIGRGVEGLNKWFTEKHEAGGVIKAQQGATFNPENKSLRNTSKKSTYNRTTNLLGSKDVLSYLNGITPENFQQFNGYEDLYDQNYTNAYGKGSLDKWGTQSLSTLKLDPRTKNMQFVWNSRGLNNPIYSGFQGVGNSGDRPDMGEDGRFGNMTIERTLGRGIDDATAARYNQILSSKGLEYYKDPTHGGYRIRKSNAPVTAPLATPRVSIPSVPAIGTIGNVVQNKSVGTAGADKALPAGRRVNITSDMLGDARFLATQFLNNRVKYNPAILATDAPELSAKVQYNLPAEAMYNQQAGRMRRFGAQAATADSTKNFAQQLEAETRALDLEGKGGLANLETYARTTEAAQNAQNQNIAARVANANQNRARAVAGQEAKAAFQRAKTMKSGQNLANWLYEKQQKLAQKENYDKSIDAEALQQQLATEYNVAKEPFIKELQAAQAQYNSDNRNNPKAVPFEQTDLYKQITNRAQTELNKVATSSVDKLRDFRRRAYGTGLGFTLYKKGGALTYAEKKALQDAKEYNKTLRENKKEFDKLLRLSITEGNKSIRGMSSYSADLIKNSLKV